MSARVFCLLCGAEEACDCRPKQAPRSRLLEVAMTARAMRPRDAEEMSRALSMATRAQHEVN